MEKARSRALTQESCTSYVQQNACRNGESPKQGIDTNIYLSFHLKRGLVEMEKARSRALTHCP